jgi:hypothetical protein
MTALQRKAILVNDKFICHKKNGKGNTLIFSRNHPTAKFVRVVVDSGIDKTTGKIVGKVGVKLCYINRQKQWREITTEVFTTNTGLVKTIQAQEAAEKFVKNCKHCKAKKFTAKSGNVVCANACWTKWGGKKKSATTQKKKPQKSSQKSAAQKTKAARQKNLQRKPQRKSAQKFAAKILPGDLVTVEQMIEGKVTTDFTGSILGVVMTVEPGGYVKTNWTANTSSLPEWELPYDNKYSDRVHTVNRFKVLSRPVEYALVS